MSHSSIQFASASALVGRRSYKKRIMIFIDWGKGSEAEGSRFCLAVGRNVRLFVTGRYLAGKQAAHDGPFVSHHITASCSIRAASVCKIMMRFIVLSWQEVNSQFRAEWLDKELALQEKREVREWATVSSNKIWIARTLREAQIWRWMKATTLSSMRN